MFSHITISNVLLAISTGFNLILLIGLSFAIRKNKKRKNENDDIADYVSNLIHVINSVRYGNLISRLGKHPNKNLNQVSKCINRMIETLNDREKMIVEYQNELKSRNDFKSAIINSLSESLVIIDNNNKIIQHSNNLKVLFNDEQIINKDISKYIKVSNDKKIIHLKNDEIFIAKNHDKRFEATTVKMGSEKYSNKYMLIIKDVTTDKEIETLKEDFVATLTHDLKVPIIAEANMLNFFLNGKFGEISDKQQEVIKNMQNSNNELLDLVHIVLDTYKIKDKGVILNRETVNLTDLISEITSEMTPTAQVSNNKLITKLQENITYSIDIIQFTRVLKNIIQNAISYGKANSDIEIKLIKNKNITLLVKDYGKGISKKDIDKIFDKYYSASKKFRKIGTGLGLYLSKEIIEAHGGELSVRSEEDKYTEFCINFPL